MQWTTQLSRLSSGRAGLALTADISPRTVSALTFVEPWELVVGVDVWAAGRCLPHGHREQLIFRWLVVPLPPLTLAETVADASFRSAATTATLFLGNPVGSMTMTSLMAVRSLEPCVFSDVDPLDSSIAPIPAAVGPELGQHYRGAAIVGLAIYASMPLLANALAVALGRAGKAKRTTYTARLATLRFPSLCMIVVGILQEGLASTGVSLLRLRHSEWDAVLGALALATSVGVCGWMLFAVTGSRLQVQLEPSDAQSEALPAFLRPLARLCLWDMHYVDVSGTQYKRRYMMLIDGLRCPWWAAVEVASATFQGAVLGPRVNSPAACNATEIVLVVQMGVMAVAAVIVRPFGAVAGNVFLVLSKLFTLTSALLLVVGGGDVEDAVDVVTSVGVGLGVLELLLSLLLLAIPVVPQVRHALAAILRPSAGGARCAEEDGAADEPLVPAMPSAAAGAGDAEQRTSAGKSSSPPLGSSPASPPPNYDGSQQLQSPREPHQHQPQLAATDPADSSGRRQIVFVFDGGVSEPTRRRGELLWAAHRLLQQTVRETDHGRRPRHMTPQRVGQALETLVACAARSRELDILQ
jgi:hypothetical protein